MLLVSWESPACDETGYIHTYVVQYCHAAAAGGLYVLVDFAVQSWFSAHIYSYSHVKVFLQLR